MLVPCATHVFMADLKLYAKNVPVGHDFVSMTNRSKIVEIVLHITFAHTEKRNDLVAQKLEIAKK